MTLASIVGWLASFPVATAFRVHLLSLGDGSWWTPPVWLSILAIPAAVLAFIVSLHIMNAWGWVCARWAEVMLGRVAAVQPAVAPPPLVSTSPSRPIGPVPPGAPAAPGGPQPPYPPGAPSPPPGAYPQAGGYPQTGVYPPPAPYIPPGSVVASPPPGEVAAQPSRQAPDDGTASPTPYPASAGSPDPATGGQPVETTTSEVPSDDPGHGQPPQADAPGDHHDSTQPT